MKKTVLWILAVLLVLALIMPVMAQVSSHFDLGWHLLSGGGGARSSAHFQIDDALGQWADGQTESAYYRIEPGFWPNGRAAELEYLYLPVAFGASGE